MSLPNNLRKSFKKSAVSGVDDQLVSAKVSGPLLISVRNPLTEELQKLDMTKKGHRAQLATLFPRSAFVVSAVQSANSKEYDFEHGKEAKEIKASFGKDFTEVFSPIAKAAKIAVLETERNEKIAVLEKKRDDAKTAFAIVAGSSDMDKILAASKPVHAATQAIADCIAEYEAKIETVRNGKIKAGARSGNGDRANPLPAIEQAQAFIRKSSGGNVLVIRGDAIRQGSERGLIGWQHFQVAKDGSDKGFWVWGGTLGNPTSNSALNLKINQDVLNLPGASIGVNGMTAVNGQNLETIRDSQLRGLPEPR